ncbi:MAG TPA: SRPBCC family protein [Ktedonobacterales bacterium]
MAQTPSTEQTVPQRLAIEDAVIVDAPIQDVFEQWSDFSRFPDLMQNVISVTPIENNRYHWVATFFGQRQEWDSQLISREEPRSIAWGSVAGQDNSGALTFTPRDDTTTEVRLHMDVTTPQGIESQQLEKLAQTVRKSTHADLRRFREQMKPQRRLEESSGGVTALAIQLGTAAAAAGAAGYAAYLADQRLKRTLGYRVMRSQVTPPANIASWALLGGSAASIAGAATYRQLGQMNNALFIGQWAPTFLGLSGLVRIMGHRGIQTHDAAAIASWSLVGGALGSIVTSVALHTLGRRKQGLFVGQWAPTLMGAAVFTRLFNRL